MAGNNSQLCRHLSSVTDGHLCFIVDFIVLLPNASIKFLVCRLIQVVAHLPAPFPFEKANTKLPDVISLSPYFKSAS